MMMVRRMRVMMTPPSHRVATRLCANNLVEMMTPTVERQGQAHHNC